MQKLIDYICDELENLDNKAGRGEKLSMAEMQYADVLAHTKKNLLKSEEGYSMGYVNREMHSNARGRGSNARRDSRGRYSSRSMRNYSMDGYSYDEDMISELRELMEEAPDERTKQEFKRFIQKIESM